jgi:hypothetical protein
MARLRLELQQRTIVDHGDGKAPVVMAGHEELKRGGSDGLQRGRAARRLGERCRRNRSGDHPEKQSQHERL